MKENVGRRSVKLEVGRVSLQLAKLVIIDVLGSGKA